MSPTYFPPPNIDGSSSSWKDQGWDEGLSKEMMDILQMILEENH